MAKKILIFAPLIIVLLFSCGFAQNESNESDERLMSESVLLLDKLDIVQKPKDNAELNNNVSRAEFAIYVGNLFNINAAASDKRFYSDVPSTHWAANSINALTESGIFVGSDNLFRPSDYITKAEACAVLLRVVGRDVEVVDKTKVENFISAARKNGILKNVTNNDLCLYDVIEMMFNTLWISPVDKTVSGDNVNYNSISDEPILTQWFKVYKNNGVLNAVKEGSVIPDKSVSEGSVLIDGITYKYTENIKDLLGQEVYVYYKQNGSEKESVLITSSGKSKIATLDICDVEYDASNDSIKYYENDKPKKLTVPADIVVLKNYENVSKDISNVFYNLHNGAVKVIDGDGNGIYDFILIDDYENIVVKNISADDKIIYDSIEENRYINLSETEYLSVFDSDKKETEFNKIDVNDVLSIYKGKNYCEIYISKDINSGTVTAVEEENGKGVFQIGERKYTIDKTYYKKAKDIIKVGTNADVYINIFDECVYADLSKTTDFVYGYIIGSGENGVFDKTLSLKIFTSESSVNIYKCAEAVKIDDVINKSYDSIKEALENGNNGNVCYQLIRYKLNSDDIITAIDTIGVQNENGVREIGRKEVGYINTSAQIGTGISLSDKTKVFVIPTDTSSEKSNEEAYQCSGRGYFVNGVTYEGEGIAYVADDSDGPWYADVILYKEDIVGGKSKNPNITKYIVKNVESFIDEEGVIKDRLVLMGGKTEVRYEEDDKSYSIKNDPNIKIGNVISIKVDGYNRIIKTDLCYGKTAESDRTALTNCLYYAETTGFSNKGTYGHYVSEGAYGRFIIKGIADGLILFNGSDTSDGKPYSLQKPICDNIAVFDMTNSKNPVRKGDLSDLYEAMYKNETVIPSINIGSISAIAIIKTK